MSKKAGISSLLSASDLNDYILPSQACILPPIEGSQDTNNAVEVGVYQKRTSTPETTEKVSISLKDCLACSGCVTSTELALIGQQTSLDFLQALKSKAVAVSISPQSIASLAVKYSTSWERMASRLCLFLKSILKVSRVFDQRVAAKIALSLSLAEFISYPRSENPVVVSQCPAVVSYIEKSHPKIVSLLSRIKTCQQILGEILKDVEDIFHVSIAPCYDKKLESFRDGETIGCVITTVELENICNDYSFDLSSSSIDGAWFDDLPRSDFICRALVIGEAEGFNDQWGTGGFLAAILSYFSARGYLVEKKEFSKDFVEWHVQDVGKSSPAMLMATCFGFKNIQNTIRKIKGSSSKYSYVEMMACPSACLNGGGQIPALNLSEISKKYSESIPDLFFSSITPWANIGQPLPFQATFKPVEAISSRPVWAQVQW